MFSSGTAVMVHPMLSVNGFACGLSLKYGHAADVTDGLLLNHQLQCLAGINAQLAWRWAQDQ